MVMGPILNEADHARVTAAVAAAEAGTDAEIVTIVARRSDAYHDVALYYAAAAMLLVLGALVVVPGVLPAKLDWLAGGWNSEAVDPRTILAALLVGQAAAFFLVQFALMRAGLRARLAPLPVRSRRVRRRAIEYFRASAEKRTVARVGILIYLSLDEHRAEIVADAAITPHVTPECWGDAMEVLIDAVKDGRIADGMAGAVAEVGTVLARNVPKTEGDRNELPDRLIEL
ncbi:TPM domain-containing protein [Sphingomonas sp. CJ99]